MKNVPVYHVALSVKYRVKSCLAIIEYRRSIDHLSCEILKYYGKRQTTKASARRALKPNKASVLKQLNKDYPGRNFTNIVID
jgi:hypothetical protein